MIKLFNYSVLALAVSTAYAEQLPQADTKQVERITVTGYRTSQLVTDQALSIASVSEQTLKEDQAQHLSESLQSISGVLLNQLSGGQGHNAAIRMPVNYGGYTLYLQDSVPLQSAAFYNHNALWWASSNSSASRLEVIKGAGTTLHGSGAVAATVNVISEAVAENRGITAGVALGEHGYTRVKGGFQSGIENEQGFRLSAAQLNNEGWRDNSSVKKTELQGRHFLQINSEQSLKTTLLASTLDQQMLSSLDADEFAEDPTQSGLPAEIEALDPRRKTDYLRLTTEWLYETADYTASVIPYIRYRNNNYIATWQPSMPQIESSVNSLGVLAQSTWQHESGETVVGLDLEHSVGDEFSVQPTTRTTTGWGAATYPAGHIFYDSTTRFTAVSPYVQHSQYLTDDLTLALGGRFDLNRYDFDNALIPYDNDGFNNRSIADRKDDFNHFSPKASLNYQVASNSSIYARYASAFRMPTAGELYRLKTRDSIDKLDDVKVETSDTFELGGKVSFENIWFEAAVYLMDVEDGLVTAYDQFGSSYRVNASRIEHRGVELSSEWQISDQFAFNVAYSESRHEFKDYIKNQGRSGREVDLAGKSLPMAPEYVLNMRLRYDSALVDGLTTLLELQSIGDYWMEDENTLEFNGYDVVNLKANYNINEKLALHARISNLTDKDYAIQGEFRYNSQRIQPGLPRTVYLGLNFQF